MSSLRTLQGQGRAGGYFCLCTFFLAAGTAINGVHFHCLYDQRRAFPLAERSARSTGHLTWRREELFLWHAKSSGHGFPSSRAWRRSRWRTRVDVFLAVDFRWRLEFSSWRTATIPACSNALARTLNCWLGVVICALGRFAFVASNVGVGLGFFFLLLQKHLLFYCRCCTGGGEWALARIFPHRGIQRLPVRSLLLMLVHHFACAGISELGFNR